MSTFLTLRMGLKDPGAILAALADMGYRDDAVEVHEQPTTLHGYAGQERRGHIAVRKDQFGGYSDLGFARDAEGAHDLLIDSDDARKIFGKPDATWTPRPGQDPVQAFQQRYNYHAYSAAAQSAMRTIQEEELEDGTVRLTVM